VEHRPAGTAELLGNRHPEPPQLRHLVVDLEVVVLLVAVGQPLALILRPALAVAEVPDRVDEILLLVAEGEVHERQPTGGGAALAEQPEEPGTRLKLVTPSLPWKHVTNRAVRTH